jgi:hypothetical protein
VLFPAGLDRVLKKESTVWGLSQIESQSFSTMEQLLDD